MTKQNLMIMAEFGDIIEKVNEIYQKYGIKSVTMDDVARELGISKKTLYSHVNNKEELVEKYLEFQVDHRRCNMRKAINKELNAIEELLEVNKYVVEMLKSYNPSTDYDLKKYYPHLYSKYRSIMMENMYKSVASNINKGKEEGLFRKELKAEIIAKVYVSRVENSFSSVMLTLEEVTSEEFINEMMIYHIRGMSNQKGIDFLENIMLNK